MNFTKIEREESTLQHGATHEEGGQMLDLTEAQLAIVGGGTGEVFLN
jgi:hypothetical protein